MVYWQTDSDGWRKEMQMVVRFGKAGLYNNFYLQVTLNLCTFYFLLKVKCA
jgi:hypothetical protein